MKHDPSIRDAIDESLSGVHFNAQDMRSVMRAVRREPAKKKRSVRRHGRRLDLVFAAVMLVLVVAPVSLFTLRARRTQPVPVASIGDPIVTQDAAQTFTPPTATIAPSASPKAQENALPGTISEDDAVRIARECYETHCDTGIFAFEEFTVRAALSEPLEGFAQYTVRMDSIYDNGCSFTVVISAADGEIIQYSTPALATQPTYLNADSEEVHIWFEQYGWNSVTWPQDVRVEFCRRYEGGVLRLARDGEISYEQAQTIAASAVRTSFPSNPEGIYAYPSLYAERASEDGVARYIVLCYAQDVTNETYPKAQARVSILASDGTVESVETYTNENAE